jgi:hypothetical protein
MESEPVLAPATAPDGTAEPPVRRPPTSVALVPAPGPDPARPARPDAWPIADWILAAPLGATKTLLDLTDAAADRLAALLGLRREAP